MSDDLTTWLRAQLDEDERLAREADGDVEVTWIADDTSEHGLLAAGAHIGWWLPSRALAEVEAKRRIIDAYQAARGQRDAMADARGRSVALRKPEPTQEEFRAMDMSDAYRHAVCLLALPYADRPGYVEEWRP